MFKKIIVRWWIVLLFFGIFFPIHVFNVVVYDMSVWKMGGMGMFSAYDHPSKRHFDLYIRDLNTGEFKKIVFFGMNDEAAHALVDMDITPSFHMFKKFYIHLQSDAWLISDESKKQIIVSATKNPKNADFDFDQYLMYAKFWEMEYAANVNNTMIVRKKLQNVFTISTYE